VAVEFSAGGPLRTATLYLSWVVMVCLAAPYSLFLLWTDTRLRHMRPLCARLGRGLAFPFVVVALVFVYPTVVLLAAVALVLSCCCFGRCRPWRKPRPWAPAAAEQRGPVADKEGAVSDEEPQPALWQLALRPLVDNPIARRHAELEAEGRHWFLEGRDLHVLSGCCWVYWFVPCCGYCLCRGLCGRRARRLSGARARGGASESTPAGERALDSNTDSTGSAPAADGSAEKLEKLKV